MKPETKITILSFALIILSFVCSFFFDLFTTFLSLVICTVVVLYQCKVVNQNSSK